MIMDIDFTKIKGLIFDYGGTLDTGGDHWSEVLWDAWQEAGVAADKGKFRECYVYAERELARTLHILPHHNFADLLKIKVNIELQHLCELGGFAPADVEAKASEIADICYKKARAKVEESKKVLEKLATRFRMVLVSNFYGNIEEVLKDFGIEHLFVKIIESAVVGVRKPDPKIFTLGVEALGMEPEDVLVVGDSYKKDIEAARKAGCMAVWLKGKQWSEEEEKIIDADTISDLGELLSRFEGI